MVSLFSRFSVSRNGYLRSKSTLDEREVVPQDTVATETTNVTGSMSTSHHGIEEAVEFKPVEHPTEPLDLDQPVQCPSPEPSILNDGRIWKERVSAGVQRRPDLPVMQEETEASPGPETPRTKSRPRTNSMILPSISAPEHNILKLLEESGIRLMWKKKIDTSFMGFVKDGAQWLKDYTDIKLVGIDYLSVAAFDDNIPAHQSRVRHTYPNPNFMIGHLLNSY